MNSKELFALAEADDAAALDAALHGAPETFRIRNESGESLYLFCVFRGRMKCAELLKTRGDFGLHEAALAGDTARVEALLKSAPSVIDMLSPDGWTALHMAAFPGNDATVVKLLDLGADARVFSRAFEQNMAMHAAAAGRRIGKQAYAKLIAASGVDALQKQGYTALMIAASNGFADGIDALLAAGANRTLKTPDGKTAADIAVDRGHMDLVQRLR
ncbi:MAG: ankyrin repeat domain-containing protein [Proteobacteria bacterium]|nr:ankyrin repeat domain-containing protein [Pseudomonadota bacterium]